MTDTSSIDLPGGLTVIPSEEVPEGLIWMTVPKESKYVKYTFIRTPPKSALERLAEEDPFDA